MPKALIWYQSLPWVTTTSQWIPSRNYQIRPIKSNLTKPKEQKWASSSRENDNLSWILEEACLQTQEIAHKVWIKNRSSICWPRPKSIRSNGALAPCSISYWPLQRWREPWEFPRMWEVRKTRTESLNSYKLKTCSKNQRLHRWYWER